MSDVVELEQCIVEIRQNPLDSHLYLQRGMVWYELKCYDECASDLMLYEALGGQDPDYMKYLGMALSKTTSRRSLDYLCKYTSSNPKDVDMKVFLAESYFQTGDYARSATIYRDAINLGFDPGIMRVKAAALAEMGQRDEAALFDPAFGKKSFFRR